MKTYLKNLTVYSREILDILYFKIRTIKKILSSTKANNFARERSSYLNHELFLINYEKTLQTKAARFKKKRCNSIAFDP